MKRKILFLVGLFVGFVFVGISIAANPPSTQTAGGLMQQDLQMNKQKNLERKIDAEKSKQDDIITPEMIPDDDGQKVLIKKIVVEGSTLLDDATIKKIIKPFENEKLSLKQMQVIADLLTDEYRKNG